MKHRVVEADLIRRIAELLVEETKPFSDRALLHTEAASNIVYAGIFRDEGSIVRYIRSKTEIFDEIMSLWDATGAEKKWSGMIMTIEGNSFDARFEYAEDWTLGEWNSDRLERLLALTYGNKKIVYPDIEEDDRALHAGV